MTPHITTYVTGCNVTSDSLSTESSKYYVRIQMAVAHGLGVPAARLAGHHSDAASKHSLCYFRSFPEYMVTRIDVHLQSGNVGIY